jgi:hypothetical protein
MRIGGLKVRADDELFPSWIPEHRLLVALVRLAITDLLVPAFAIEYASARRWFYSNERGPFSFLDCCSHLGVDPNILRSEMKRLSLSDRQRIVRSPI